MQESDKTVLRYVGTVALGLLIAYGFLLMTPCTVRGGYKPVHTPVREESRPRYWNFYCNVHRDNALRPFFVEEQWCDAILMWWDLIPLNSPDRYVVLIPPLLAGGFASWLLVIRKRKPR